MIYRALSPANKIEDPYSPEAQDLLKLTNLRLLLLKRQECPCHGSGLVEKPQRFAHYAIYDLIIRGSCFCNGHAEECELANKTGVVENMVSSRHLSAYCTCFCCLSLHVYFMCDPVPASLSISQKRAAQSIHNSETHTTLGKYFLYSFQQSHV